MIWKKNIFIYTRLTNANQKSERGNINNKNIEHTRLSRVEKL